MATFSPTNVLIIRQNLLVALSAFSSYSDGNLSVYREKFENTVRLLSVWERDRTVEAKNAFIADCATY